MKYKIESDLKNFEGALKILAEPDASHLFEQVLQLTRKHRLFKLALDLFSDRPEELRKVQETFGEYLMERGYEMEAGQLFMAAGIADERALKAFKKSLSVDLAIGLGLKLGLNGEEMDQLKLEMVEALVIKGKTKEAADLL